MIMHGTKTKCIFTHFLHDVWSNVSFHTFNMIFEVFTFIHQLSWKGTPPLTKSWIHPYNGLQYDLKKGSSMSVCPAMIQETISHFVPPIMVQISIVWC